MADRPASGQCGDIVAHCFLRNAENHLKYLALRVTCLVKILKLFLAHLAAFADHSQNESAKCFQLCIGKAVSLRRASVISSETFMDLAIPVCAGTQ